MKPIFNICCLLLLLAGAPKLRAQGKDTSIHFRNFSFSQALQESRKTGRLVFIDCYTSWCAPCKWMERNVFINDSVYRFFNRHFVNVKIDMEKGEGVELRKRYAVESFPTYLFVNENGDVVHRTASRMEVQEFLAEGKRAIDPNATYAFLKKQYESGDRSNSMLFKYAMALRKVNRNQGDQVEQELVKKMTDTDLSTELGWQVISNIARNENDRLGKHLVAHRNYFEGLAGKEAVNTVVTRLGIYTMYGLIRDQDSTAFFKRLDAMRTNPDKKMQRDVAMLEMEYYLTSGNTAAFVATANRAMTGILEYNDMDLSFVARRALYMAKGSAPVLQQALIMARKAVVLNPEEYSNQGTLASICLELKLKEEGLAAARKARQLADDSTSKIQKLAQDLVNKIQAL